MAYARDLKSLVLYGLVGSNPTSAIMQNKTFTEKKGEHNNV